MVDFHTPESTTIGAEDLDYVVRLLGNESGERARSKERQRRMASRAG